MARIPERFLILSEAGAGYLERLHYVHQLMTNPKLKPVFLTDKALEKVVREMSRKFPEFPPDIDRLAGSDGVIAKARDWFDRLETIFQLFVDISDWKDEAIKALYEGGSAITTLKWDENPFLMTAFLDVVTLLAQLMLTMSQLPERKTMVIVYGRTYQNMRAQADPNLQKIARFLHDYEAPLRHLPTELQTVSPKVGAAVCASAMDWIRSRDVSVLRKEGTLSLSTNPAQMSLPSQEPFMYLLGNTQKLYNWILYGFLLCPDELALSEALPMVKLALSIGYAAPLTRDLSFLMHDEYEEAFEKHKNKTFKAQLKKEKNLIKEALAQAVAGGRRTQRRVYIRQELAALLGLLRDQPGLLAPKLQLVLAALAVGREELQLYFRHLDTPPPKGSARLPPDPRVLELIHCMLALVALVRQHAALVRQYYATYLSSTHQSRAAELAAELGAKVPAAAPLVRALVDASRNVKDTATDLRAIRLNWLRAEHAVAVANVPVPHIAVALKKFALMARHTRYVDALEECLAEAASLRLLWYWREALGQAVDRGLETGGPVLAAVRVLGQAPDNAHAHTPEEREAAGQDAVALARSILEKLAHRVGQLLAEGTRQQVAFEMQLHPENAAYPWLVRLKDYKPDKNLPPPVPPGSESEFKQRQTLEGLRVAQNCLASLLTACNESVSLFVYDQMFTPREYVREALAAGFREFLQKVAYASPPQFPPEQGLAEPEIQRPSVVERYVLVYHAYVKSLENYLDLHTAEQLREVWLGSVYNKVLAGQLLDWANDQPVDLGSTLVRPFIAWYAEFVAKRVVHSKEKEVFFSPTRKGFFSKPNMAFKPERLVDFVELRALCSLLGPYGVKLLDREVLRVVLQNVVGMKDVLVNNRAALDEIGKNHQREAAFAEALKKLRPADLDGFMARLVAVGNSLHFRQLLHEALRLCTEEKVPYIYSAVAAAFAQYPRNVFSSTDQLAVDTLACELGQDVAGADHVLKTYVQRAMGGADAALWALLPPLCAAALLASKTGLETECRPLTDTFSHNLHVVPLAVAQLIAASKATPSSGTPDPRDITAALMSFFEISATALLRSMRAAKPGERKVYFASVVLLLDRFVDSSPFVTREMVEPILPYALVRSCAREIYDVKAVGPEES